MPTSDYKIDGERVPGTTTIINRFKDSGGLNYWYWEQGDKGIPFGKTGKDAASAGTIAHAMVECDLSGKKWVKGEFPEDIVKMAWGAYASYIQWKEQTKLSLVSLETPLISRLYRYGGTPDAIVEIGGSWPSLTSRPAMPSTATTCSKWQPISNYGRKTTRISQSLVDSTSLDSLRKTVTSAITSSLC